MSSKHKKHKTSKHTDKTRFESKNQDIDFERLMNESGVKGTGQSPSIPKFPESKSTQNDPVEFDKQNDLNLNLNFVKPKEKFIGQQKSAPARSLKRKRKIRPGFQPDAEFDLHGKTKNEAIQLLKEIFRTKSNLNYKNILIITGKGLNSDQSGGILREFTWNWLKAKQNQGIESIDWAPPFLGGKGAILVFFS